MAVEADELGVIRSKLMGDGLTGVQGVEAGDEAVDDPLADPTLLSRKRGIGSSPRRTRRSLHGLCHLVSALGIKSGNGDPVEPKCDLVFS